MLLIHLPPGLASCSSLVCVGDPWPPLLLDEDLQMPLPLPRPMVAVGGREVELLLPSDRTGGSGLSTSPSFRCVLYSILLQIYSSLSVSYLCVITILCSMSCFPSVDLMFGFQPTTRNPLADVRQFVLEFESEYGRTHPPFVESTYEQVRKNNIP